MIKSYSTWEAKTHFSEILRQVREGKTVYISYRGERVAEIRPIASTELSLQERLASMETANVLEPASRPLTTIEPIVRREGALARFLESRD